MTANETGLATGCCKGL